MINDVPVDWKRFKIPKKSTNQNPNITKNQVCLSVCRSVALYVSIIIVYFHVILMMTDILL